MRMALFRYIRSPSIADPTPMLRPPFLLRLSAARLHVHVHGPTLARQYVVTISPGLNSAPSVVFFLYFHEDYNNESEN